MWLPIAMAALSFLQNRQKQDQYGRDVELQAETTRMNPFTGMRAEAPQRPNAPIADVLGGALQGASVANAFEDYDLDKKLKEQLLASESSKMGQNLDLGPGLQPPASILNGPDIEMPPSVLTGEAPRPQPEGYLGVDLDMNKPRSLYGSMARRMRRPSPNQGGASGGW